MTNKEKQEKISRIIELQSIITSKIINGRNTNNKYHPAIGDEYQPIRDELKKLRDEMWDYLHPKSCLPGGDPQVPDLDLDEWRENFDKDQNIEID